MEGILNLWAEANIGVVDILLKFNISILCVPNIYFSPSYIYPEPYPTYTPPKNYIEVETFIHTSK